MGISCSNRPVCSRRTRGWRRLCCPIQALEFDSASVSSGHLTAFFKKLILKEMFSSTSRLLNKAFLFLRHSSLDQARSAQTTVGLFFSTLVETVLRTETRKAYDCQCTRLSSKSECLVDLELTDCHIVSDYWPGCSASDSNGRVQTEFY